METLRPPKGATHQRKRLGRGSGSGHGTTAGKGTKGQNSRSGGGVRPGFEGGQMPLYRRVARRGFSNYRFKKDYVVVSLDSIASRYSSGDTVSLETLREHKLIGKRDALVKILGDGELKKKLSVVGVRVSRSAAAKITAAGGTVDNVAGPAESKVAEEKVEVAPSKGKKASEETADAVEESKETSPKAEAAPKKKAAPKAKKPATADAEAEKKPASPKPKAAKKPVAKAEESSAVVDATPAPKKSTPKKSAPKAGSAKKPDSGAESEADTAEKDSE
jgi:large subunit ribosomal protein L15